MGSDRKIRKQPEAWLARTHHCGITREPEVAAEWRDLGIVVVPLYAEDTPEYLEHCRLWAGLQRA